MDTVFLLWDTTPIRVNCITFVPDENSSDTVGLLWDTAPIKVHCITTKDSSDTFYTWCDASTLCITQLFDTINCISVSGYGLF